ncbi:MAG: hypothetical protein ACYTHN_17495, partial [Planctomycetota bacterium]
MRDNPRTFWVGVVLLLPVLLVAFLILRGELSDAERESISPNPSFPSPDPFDPDLRPPDARLPGLEKKPRGGEEGDAIQD